MGFRRLADHERVDRTARGMHDGGRHGIGPECQAADNRIVPVGSEFAH